jgi:hydroxymethylpyrimidine/phosphomethylpyrimidine kinase
MVFPHSKIRTPKGLPPAVLTIAGSDSSGGAGIQADLKTFAALGCFGTSAITCVTAQNPGRVSGVHPLPSRFVREQVERVKEAFPLAAVKTGMIYSGAILEAVLAARTGALERIPWVIDPVMVSTSGAVLLQPDAVDRVKKKLLPVAALVTPNCDEAALLLGWKIRTLAQLHRAARELSGRFGVPFLVKGGHLRQRLAVDVLCDDGTSTREFSAPMVPGVNPHGTGCTLSAAITAALARGQSLEQAVGTGKAFISRAIEHRVRLGADDLLNTLPQVHARRYFTTRS